MKQRDKMRQLYAGMGGNKSRCVRAYAQAELKGEVPRKSNRYRLSAEAYAAALFEDGVRKAWL